MSNFCFIIQGKGSLVKGLILNTGGKLFSCIWFLTPSGLLVCAHTMKWEENLIVNVLFVSITFSAGKGFCEIFLSLWIELFCVIFELN